MTPILLLIASLQDALPVVVVDRDNVVIAQSCRVEISCAISDADGNGVIQIRGDGLTVDLTGAVLRGAPDGMSPDQYTGIGIRLSGSNLTVRGAAVSGYKIGILASEADGLTLEGCDVSGNFQQRLRSTTRAEDGADWLWPHKNDEHEWRTNYGAGICIERSTNVTVRDCRARHGQNGLLLDRVRESRVYDNDFSFLSGWGLAMWRCEKNLVSRNALDFCVRGYSHGVYNRGQDSAGILFFEQNVDNAVIENSATHGGDGFFAFAGRAALGEDWMERERERLRKETGKDQVDDLLAPSDELLAHYRKRGNRGNKLVGNDFSYAAAHGLELTFSFDNLIAGNRLVGNAICGIWGGYSQNNTICNNTFESNGEGAYGLERGGINIEHGRKNLIIGNQFRDNAVGVHLWWDDDPGLMATPWAKANGTACAENEIIGNSFDGDALAVQLRAATRTLYVGNKLNAVKKELDAAPDSAPVTDVDPSDFDVNCSTDARPLGRKRPVGARKHLYGRDKIIMTPWGPYDWEAPLLVPADDAPARTHAYRLLGAAAIESAQVEGEGVEARIVADRNPPEVHVVAAAAGEVTSYALRVRTGGRVLRQAGMLIDMTWSVRVFNWTSDPREKLDEWHAQALGGVAFETPQLDLRYGGGGPSDLKNVPAAVLDAKLGRERFGTIAAAGLTLPAGRWLIHTESDDGIRVWVDDKLVLDDWTWHAPKRQTVEFNLDQARRVALRVEHFELDGFATLSVALEALPR